MIFYLFFFLFQQAGDTAFSSLVYEFILLAIGLFLSALYSSSEVALFSLVNQLDKLDASGEHAASDSRILKMLDKPRRLLSTILIGNTFANIVSRSEEHTSELQSRGHLV